MLTNNHLLYQISTIHLVLKNSSVIFSACPTAARSAACATTATTTAATTAAGTSATVRDQGHLSQPQPRRRSQAERGGGQEGWKEA